MAKIKLNNNEYLISDSTLATPTADFIAHLGTVAGNGLKVVVGGVEYGVDSSKMSATIAALETVFGNLSGGGDEPIIKTAGLYQTGTDTMIKSWEDLLSSEAVRINNGALSRGGNGTDILTGDLILPNDGSVTSIGSATFSNCSGLTSVEISDSVTSIQSNAFSNCINLANIAIGDNVTYIHYTAFNNTAYYNNESNWENGVLYVGKYLIVAQTTIEGPYAVKDGTPWIGPLAFYNCKNLTSVEIPDSVTSIGTQAFSKCSSLTSVKIPDSVTSIGDYAFDGCKNLTSIKIPNSVESLGGWAFRDCSSLASVVIGDSVTSIGLEVFYNCTNLTSVVIPNGVSSIGYKAFYGCGNLCVYYKGASSSWSKISIDSNNVNLNNATKYYYSESQPTTSGKYWHYDENGNVAIW